MSVIDPTTDLVTGTAIPVGSCPVGIAFDGTNVHVTNADGDTVSVLRPR